MSNEMDVRGGMEQAGRGTPKNQNSRAQIGEEIYNKFSNMSTYENRCKVPPVPVVPAATTEQATG